MLVLERAADAQARGADIVALITGFAATCDAFHLTAPDPTAAQATRALQAALAQAGLEATDIHYVNAHGTGTRDNDAAEATILRNVFPKVPPVSSTKRLTGHTFGAAGAIEVILTALALCQQVLPPNAGGIDPEDWGLPLVRAARAAKIATALSCNFAFGGNNTATLLSRGVQGRKGRQNLDMPQGAT